MTSTAAWVPSGIDDVTSGWLTDVLRTDDSLSDSLSVNDIHIERIAEETGFSSLLYRVRLSGTPELPPSVIVKLPGSPEARGAMEMLGGYRRELDSTGMSRDGRRWGRHTYTPPGWWTARAISSW